MIHYQFTMQDPIYTVRVSELGHWQIYRSKISVCKGKPDEKMYLLRDEALEFAYQKFLMWRRQVNELAEKLALLPRVEIDKLLKEYGAI